MADDLPRSIDPNKIITRYKRLVSDLHSKIVVLEVAYEELAENYQGLQEENQKLKASPSDGRGEETEGLPRKTVKAK